MNREHHIEPPERMERLKNLRVVLVEVKFPGNVGMTARAMKNTGLTDLRLVRPRAELNKEAYQLASGAAEVLDRARFHESLADAVGDCGMVIGTTRRSGVMRRHMVGPEQAAAMLVSPLQTNAAALVFGSEDNGLANDDLVQCQWLVGLHTGSDHESFNLSHSVAIIAYLVNRAVVAPDEPPRRLAPAHEREDFYADFERCLNEIGFMIEADPRRMMMTFRQIFHRADLSARDVRVLRGVLRQIRWRIQNPHAPLLPRDTPQEIKREIIKTRKDQRDE
jgi:tRNA/rRNA methyltransferase